MINRIKNLLEGLYRRFEDYMWPASLSVGATFVTVGFVLMEDTTNDDFDKIMVKAIIISGILLMSGSMFFIPRAERKQSGRDQALLLNLMAIAIKMGVSLDELKLARQTLDKIDALTNGKHKIPKDKKL